MTIRTVKFVASDIGLDELGNLVYFARTNVNETLTQFHVR